MLGVLALGVTASAGPALLFDSGEEEAFGADRQYQSAEICVPAHPCQLTVHGALWFDFDEGDRETTDVDIYYQQNNHMRSLQMLQFPVEKDHTALWYAAHRVRNDAVVHIDDLLSEDDAKVFLYGVDLKYNLQNASLIIVEVNQDDETERYYFRYWDTTLGLSVDITTLFPAIGYASPRVQPRLDASTVTLALSLRAFRRSAPDEDPNGYRFFLGGFHPTILAGALNEFTVSEEGIVTQTDIFIGTGVTIARFAGVGYGWTVWQPERGGFPYAALNIDEMVRILLDVTVNQTRQWDDYEARERR